MKKLVALMILIVGMVGSDVQAQSVGKEFVRRIVEKGVEAVQKKLDVHGARKGEEANDRSSMGDAEAAERMQGEEPIPVTRRGFTRLMYNAMLSIVENVKEQYKEEGRIYVRQVGDLLAERITQNKKVESTIFMLKLLAWFVVIYLTLVTALLIWLLKRLNAKNERILELLEARAEEKRASY